MRKQRGIQKMNNDDPYEKYLIEEEEKPKATVAEDSDPYEKYAVDQSSNEAPVPGKTSLRDKFMNFMNPSNIDKGFNVMPETFLGRMPRPENVPEFKKDTPENKYLLEQMINNMAGMPGINEIGRIGNLVKNAARTGMTAFKGLKPLEQSLEETTESHAAKQEQEAAIKEQAKFDLGQSDYATMQNKLDKNKEELNSINQKLEVNLPKPEEYLLDTPKEMEKRYLNSSQAEEKATKQAANVEKQIGEHLDTGASHDVRTAKIVKSKLKENKEDIQSEFKDLEKDYADKNITINNDEKIQALNNDLFQMVHEGKHESKEAMKLNDEIFRLSQMDAIPAKDYVSAYRSVNGYMRDAYKKAYEPGINEEVRKQWLKRANEAETKLGEMDKVLEQSLGKEDYAKFKATNSRWRTEVVPLYKNKLYHQIMNDERLPDNMIKELRGEGSGMDLLKNIIKNDPQALKHVVGQRYDVAPASVHAPDELMKEYTDLMPELKGLTQNKQEADMLVQKAKEQTALHKTFKGEAQKLNKTYQQKLGNRANLEEQKNDLEKTIQLMEKHIPELKKAAENKKLALKEKLAAKHRLQRAEQKKAAARKKLKIIGTIVAAPLAAPLVFSGGKQAISGVGKLLSSD